MMMVQVITVLSDCMNHMAAPCFLPNVTVAQKEEKNSVCAHVVTACLVLWPVGLVTWIEVISGVLVQTMRSSDPV